jgi:hypothetical protein
MITDAIRKTEVYDQTAIREAYDKSDILDWRSFANSVGLDVDRTTHQLPTRKWVQEKRARIHEIQAESLMDELFDYKSVWHKEVIKTLRTYPQGADLAYKVATRLLLKLDKQIESNTYDEEYISLNVKNAVSALKMAVETKHKTLLLNQWEIKRVEDEFKQTDALPTSENFEWKMELVGGEKLTSKQMQRLIDQYIDKPSKEETIEAEFKEDESDE